MFLFGGQNDQLINQLKNNQTILYKKDPVWITG